MLWHGEPRRITATTRWSLTASARPRPVSWFAVRGRGTRPGTFELLQPAVAFLAGEMRLAARQSQSRSLHRGAAASVDFQASLQTFPLSCPSGGWCGGLSLTQSKAHCVTDEHAWGKAELVTTPPPSWPRWTPCRLWFPCRAPRSLLKSPGEVTRESRLVFIRLRFASQGFHLSWEMFWGLYSSKKAENPFCFLC